MATLRDGQLVSLLRKAGFQGEGLKTMYGIVHRESGANPRAFNGNRKTGDRSYGLAQINMLGDMGKARMRQFRLSSYDDLFDPLTNLKAAYRMSKGGKDFGAWGIGANAYRSGAGYDTIKKYVDAFPKATRDLELEPTGTPDKPGKIRTLADMGDMTDFDHHSLAMQSLQALTSGQYDPMEGLAEITALRAKRAGEAAPAPTVPESRRPGAEATAPATQAPKGAINLSTTKWHETPHAGGVTSGLGWGNDEPMDIMGSPGTPVGAPAAGEVIDHGTAQEGGLSVTIMGSDGYEYWLGHLEDLPPIGTKVKPGQIVGTISGKHPRPHVHATRIRRK